MTFERGLVYRDLLEACGKHLLACLIAALLCVLAPAPSIAATVPGEGRAYEQVTPVDSGGTQIEMQIGALALSGTGLSYLGKPPGEGTDSAAFHTRLLAVRGKDDWEAPVGLDPPIGPHETKLWQATLAVARDGTHALVATNVKLTPGAAEGPDAANLYLKDLRTGTYELVAATSKPGAFEEFVQLGGYGSFMGGTDDLDAVVFLTRIPLLPEVSGTAVYRWTRSGGLEVVSRLPDETVAEAVTRLPEPLELAKRWVSADGSRVLFGLEDGRLFMRIDEETVPVAVSEIDGEEKSVTAQGIDVKGRFVFFTSPDPMTSDSPVGGNAPHLYRYDLETGDLEYIDDTSRAAGAEASTLAVSPDGQSVAYLAKDPSEILPERRMAIWHDGEARLLLETHLPSSPIRAAQFSSNSRYLAFSEAEGLSPGVVYLYDTDSGQLSCASCIGGTPTMTAVLPLGERLVNNRLPHAVDDEGRLFFTSTVALLPEDTNDVEDVYAFHAGRLSLISPGDGAYPAFLMDISDDGSDVYFGTEQSLVAQDINGERDVYDARVGGGFAGQNELPPAPCIGEGCRGAPPIPPSAVTIGSESAGGAGRKARMRHRHCKKGRVKVKGKCVKRKGR